jgi:hypothetical protein
LISLEYNLLNGPVENTVFIDVGDMCDAYPVYSKLLGAVEDGGGLLENNSHQVSSDQASPF